MCTNIKIKLNHTGQRHGHVSQCYRANPQIETRTFNLSYASVEDNITYMQTITIALFGTTEMRSGLIVDAYFAYDINILNNYLVVMYIHQGNIISQDKIDLLDENIYTLTTAEVIDQNENKIVIF